MIIGDVDGRFDMMAEIMDTIFARCDDDPACIAGELKNLDPGIRDEILASDLLNAWQVFWYFFAAYPGDEAVEYLIFHSASELSRGVPMGEYDILSLRFHVIGGTPLLILSDDIQEVGRYSGSSAWTAVSSFIENGE
jgi:hypothetical protein